VEGSNGDVRALGGELKKAEAALKRSKTGVILGASVFCDLFAALVAVCADHIDLWDR
jgi:hypothetical protein